MQTPIVGELLCYDGKVFIVIGKKEQYSYPILYKNMIRKLGGKTYEWCVSIYKPSPLAGKLYAVSSQTQTSSNIQIPFIPGL